MKSSIIMAAALAVAGCVQTEVVPGPGGRQAILIDCSDAWSDGDCYREAAKQCPGGYELLQPPAANATPPQTHIFVRCMGGVKAKQNAI